MSHSIYVLETIARKRIINDNLKSSSIDHLREKDGNESAQNFLCFLFLVVFHGITNQVKIERG